MNFVIRPAFMVAIHCRLALSGEQVMGVIV